MFLLAKSLLLFLQLRFWRRINGPKSSSLQNSQPHKKESGKTNFMGKVVELQGHKVT